MASGRAKVFISYSHDSPEHADLVLALAERLRSNGVDARIDQYVAGTPVEGWPRWMLNQLDWADFVLVVCTETYYRRFRGHEVPGKGKGADWEGNLITLEMYDAKSTTTKFAPVLFDGQNTRFIPEPLRGHTQYLLNSEENYDKLYAFLVGQASVPPGEVGPLKKLTRKQVNPLIFENVGVQKISFSRPHPRWSWMRTMDKFSWIPFAVVIVGTLRLLLVEQPSPSDVNLIFWLVTLGLFGLPFFVIISSFFRYPNRRFFEFAGSLISWAIGVGIFVYELSTDRNFYAYGWLYFALVQLFLLTLGTALKLQVLISR